MLYIKDTSMLVAGVAVPGLVKKLEITEAAVIDAVTDDNNVTLGYQPNGYEPLKMNVDLLLEPAPGKALKPWCRPSSCCSSRQGRRPPYRCRW